MGLYDDNVQLFLQLGKINCVQSKAAQVLCRPSRPLIYSMQSVWSTFWFIDDINMHCAICCLFFVEISWAEASLCLAFYLLSKRIIHHFIAYNYYKHVEIYVCDIKWIHNCCVLPTNRLSSQIQKWRAWQCLVPPTNHMVSMATATCWDATLRRGQVDSGIPIGLRTGTSSQSVFEL